MALISLNNLERFFNNLKTYISNALNSKVDSNNLKTINNNSLVGTGNITITASSVDWDNVNNKPSTFTPSTHTHAASDITSGLATVATSGSYNDLSNKPTIPTVNNATLTIQKNGTTVKTFTANASSNVTANITVPTKTSDLTNDSGFLTSHQDLSGYVPRSGGQVFTGSAFSRTSNAKYLELNGGTDWNHGAGISLRGKDCNDWNDAGCFLIKASDGTNDKVFTGRPNGALYWGSKNVAMQEDVVPRSGGPVITSSTIGRVDNSSYLNLCGGLNWSNGATISLMGKDTGNGCIKLHPNNGTLEKDMLLKSDGTWTWNGTAVQVTSDQRYKQQISEIDDDLLTAWEDVDLVQFKYNDAVEQKGDNARLHTGYVVQQIDEACKSHGVDISEYGLYCHEEYPERTEEVEVQQEDGTTTKETKVIEEASEHYSLRYTETLVVECAYLRRENKRLNDRLTTLEELFKQYIAK